MGRHEPWQQRPRAGCAQWAGQREQDHQDKQDRGARPARPAGHADRGDENGAGDQIDPDRCCRTHPVEQCAGDGADKEAWSNRGKSQPTGQCRRGKARQDEQDEGEAKHAGRQARQRCRKDQGRQAGDRHQGTIRVLGFHRSCPGCRRPTVWRCLRLCKWTTGAGLKRTRTIPATKNKVRFDRVEWLAMFRDCAVPAHKR